MKALLQEAEDMSGSGRASGHLLNRSMKVRRYRHPSDSGRGPTKSTWTLPNRRVAGGMTVTGVRVWRPTLELWQGTQDLHQARTSFLTSGHTKREVINLRDGLTPGWLSPCRASKICWRNCRGTSGRIIPCEVSHHKSTPFQATLWSWRLD